MTAGLWRGEEPILLASTSSTRRALLEVAGLPVETESPDIDERALQAGWGATAPDEIAARLAAAKAQAVSARRPSRWVVGADQVLSCGGETFSKAANAQEAGRQLARLGGRTHRLHAAVALARGGATLAVFVEAADLTLRRLDEDAIALYLRLAGPAATRSVGAYEVEGLGIHLFERIEGDHTTILGLPMLRLLALLRERGLLAL